LKEASSDLKSIIPDFKSMFELETSRMKFAKQPKTAYLFPINNYLRRRDLEEDIDARDTIHD